MKLVKVTIVFAVDEDNLAVIEDDAIANGLCIDDVHISPMTQSVEILDDKPEQTAADYAGHMTIAETLATIE